MSNITQMIYACSTFKDLHIIRIEAVKSFSLAKLETEKFPFFGYINYLKCKLFLTIFFNLYMLQTSEFLILVGIKIKSRRMELDLTRISFGAKCNMSDSTIGSIERGEKNISFLKLFALCIALETTLHTLLEGI